MRALFLTLCLLLAGCFETDETSSAYRDCEHCPLMVTVSADTFLMGPWTIGEYIDKSKAVRLDIKEFAIGVHEVSVAEWNACVVNGGCRKIAEMYRNEECKLEAVNLGERSTSLPVVSVTKSDTRDYVDWLNSITAGGYRLPSEAEWEYAALAGSEARYWWGTTFSYEQANAGRRKVGSMHKSTGDDWNCSAPVESFPSNPNGLKNVSGNVAEWVQDCYGNDPSERPLDGSAVRPPDGESVCRSNVAKGGSYLNAPKFLAIRHRPKIPRKFASPQFGFRIAK